MHRFLACCCWLVVMLLAGCATHTMPGYQNTYQGYSIPEPLLARIRQKFAQHGLARAVVGRDNVGRVRLAGSYRDDDEVDVAFTIVQSIVGMKSTSPFYPQDVKERRWEAEAARAMADYAAAQRQRGAGGPGVRRALVIGINRFADRSIPDILGEDDARIVRDKLARNGYSVTALLGAQATRANIEGAVATMERDLRPQDALFIYVSSHGAPPVPTARGGDGRNMSIVAYDTRTHGDYVDQGVAIQQSSVKDALIQRLAQRPSRVTRVVIDTCYSGEILRGVPDDSRQFIAAQNGGRPDREGVSLAVWSGGAIAGKGIRYAGPVEPAAKADFTSRANYTFITATSEGEKSWGPENGTFTAPIGGTRELKGSFFTQTFLGWLELHNGQVLPAFEQASVFTQGTVSKARAGRDHQTPRMFSTLSTSEDNIFQF